MSENNLIQLLKTAFIGGIFCLLLWKLFDEGSFANNYTQGGYDPAYEYDLLADSGNYPAYPELDQTLLQSRKILLTTDINAVSTKLIVGSLLALNAQDPKAPIDLYVRTNGGYYDDAFAVVDAIRLIEAPVNTYAVGGSHSSGTIIVASGTGKRYAYENAILMAHDNLSEAAGRYSVDDLENERIRRFWQQFNKIPDNWFSEAGDSMNYINARQALEMGIIDEILHP